MLVHYPQLKYLIGISIINIGLGLIFIGAIHTKGTLLQYILSILVGAFFIILVAGVAWRRYADPRKSS